METIKALINGNFIESQTRQFVEMLSPLTQECIAKAPYMLKEEIIFNFQENHSK